jgi:hypothetical protein
MKLTVLLLCKYPFSQMEEENNTLQTQLCLLLFIVGAKSGGKSKNPHT